MLNKKTEETDIDQLIHLRQSFCSPRFKSQASHQPMPFQNIMLPVCHHEKDENKQNEAGFGPYLQTI